MERKNSKKQTKGSHERRCRETGESSANVSKRTVSVKGESCGRDERQEKLESFRSRREALVGESWLSCSRAYTHTTTPTYCYIAYIGCI